MPSARVWGEFAVISAFYTLQNLGYTVPHQGLSISYSSVLVLHNYAMQKRTLCCISAQAGSCSEQNSSCNFL